MWFSYFFAVPAAAPETTEGGFEFKEFNKVILYWKVGIKKLQTEIN